MTFITFQAKFILRKVRHGAKAMSEINVKMQNTLVSWLLKHKIHKTSFSV